MMRSMAILLVLVLSSAAHAKDFDNGCGSGWNEPLVPDRVGPLGFDFRLACKEHDNCYSRCLEGGANFEKPICKQSLEEQREGRRDLCDKQFFENATAGCASVDMLRRPICAGVAAIYKIAIRMGGKGSFNGFDLPDAYFDFIVSREAESFDFLAFERKTADVLLKEGIRESDREPGIVKIDVQRGPSADGPRRVLIQWVPVAEKPDLGPKGLGPVLLRKTKAAKDIGFIEVKDLDIRALGIKELNGKRYPSGAKP